MPSSVRFSISLDYGAGPVGTSEPLGIGGEAAQWATSARTFQRMFGREGGATGIDDDFIVRSVDNIGAWILGGTCSARPWSVGGFSLEGMVGENRTIQSSCSVTLVPRSAWRANDVSSSRTEYTGIGACLRSGRRSRCPPWQGVATIQRYLTAGLVDEMRCRDRLLGSGGKSLRRRRHASSGTRSGHVATDGAAHFVRAVSSPVRNPIEER
jgi:hypothetical protein